MGTAKSTDNLLINLGLFTAVLIAFEHLAALHKSDEAVKLDLNNKLAAEDSDIATLREQLATASAPQGQPLPDDLQERVNNLLNDPLLSPVEPGVAPGTGGNGDPDERDFDFGVNLAETGGVLPTDANDQVRAGFASVVPKQPTDLTGKPVPAGAYASLSTGGAAPDGGVVLRPGAGSVNADPGSGFAVGDPAGSPVPREPEARVDVSPSTSTPGIPPVPAAAPGPSAPAPVGLSPAAPAPVAPAVDPAP